MARRNRLPDREIPPLAPLIPWPGGQSKDVRKLEKFFPGHDTYVEPFAGGASFFFWKRPAKKEVIGDTSKWLIDFYNDVRKGKARACAGGISYSESNYWKSAKKKNPTTCDRLTMSALGFDGGQRMSFSTGPGHRGVKTGEKIWQRKLSKLGLYEGRLKQAYLSRMSFEKTMKKFDSPDAFHFVDPPWPVKSAKRYYEGNVGVTVDTVGRVASKMKGKVWVIYNMDPKIARILHGHGLKIYRVRTVRTGGQKGSQKYEKLIAANYDIKTGKPLRRARR